jgi:hypothetical protein
MKTPVTVFSALIASLGLLPAAEGISTDWTQVADADRHLMGDYQGEWLDAPRGHYFEINKPLAAQVINVREGEYFLRFYQEHDMRADPYFEGQGKLDGGVIRFADKGWNGEVGKDGLKGSAPGPGGSAIRFELKRVARSSPTLGMKAPEGATVLFDGSNFDRWEHGGGRAVSWHLLENGAMEVRSARNQEERQNGIGGDIQTKESFGDCRVHLEFRYPVEPGKSGQGRGNSGFFLQGDYEVQVLNSYGLHGWWNECGALYKTRPPQVNAARPPMEWQTYDVDYQASVWKDGKKVSPPRITVRHNGVLIHHDQEIPHATAHAFASRMKEPQGPGPIRLQDHSNAIQFRNIWILPGKQP